MTSRDALALVTINVVWGASYVVTKDALGTMPPLTLAFARFALAWAVFALLAAASRTEDRGPRTDNRRPATDDRSGRRAEDPEPAHDQRASSAFEGDVPGSAGVPPASVGISRCGGHRRAQRGGHARAPSGPSPTMSSQAAVGARSHERGERWSRSYLVPMVGLLGFCLDYVFLYHGLRLTTASDAAILVNMEAIFTALLGAALLRERIGGRAAWGVAAACAGALLLLRPEPGSAGDRRALGNALILVALVCEALATVLSRPLRRHWTPLALTRRLVGWGALGLLPLALYEVHRAPQPMTWLTPATLEGVAYLALGCTVFCYSVWYGLLGRIEAGRAAAFLYVQPVVGVALGITLQHDRIRPAQIAGGMLIGLGIAVVSLRQNVRQ